MVRRSRAREVVLQVLYEDDLNPSRNLAIADQFLKKRLHNDPALVEFKAAYEEIKKKLKNDPDQDILPALDAVDQENDPEEKQRLAIKALQLLTVKEKQLATLAKSVDDRRLLQRQ